MKKKSASRSAFFNFRVLIGVFIVLAGVFLALAGLGTFSAITASSAQAQQKQKHKIINIQGLPPGFDCSKIHELGIDRMEGLKWGLIMLACGEGHGGFSSATTAFGRLIQKLLPVPLAYGAADVNLVSGTETFPNTTQSETYTTANPDNANEVCVAFNDSRGASSSNFSGISCSTDGGMSFTRVTNASGNSPFGSTFGDPVLLYNKPTATWFTVWLDGNGSCTLGGFKSSDPEDPNSWTHFCVHSSSSDDRPSGWADNNPSSPHFGNMYVSWNDFGIGAGALVVSRSTDNGATWSSEITVANGSTFIRDVQITGDFATGDVYIAGMDEGGGNFPHNDTNLIFKSTDGGATWNNTYTGTPFPGPGVIACSINTYFTCMFTDNGGYWRHQGWGEPAALNGIVHYVYAQHGTGSDPGDVYYIRSTDGGVTFSSPFKLNTDSTTRPQWQPNLSVSPAGTLLATWYDARESTSCTEGNQNVPCYRMYSRKSNDGGVTWLPDDTLSDVVSPLAAEQDPNIFSNYAGDYDYGSAILTKHTTSWMDGRNVVNNQSQQDAYTDRELVGFSVTTTNPACNSVISTQPTDFVINLSDAVDPSTVQATDFTVNGTPANSFTLSNGNATITFHFNSSPVTAQGPQTMNIPAGAFNRASDNMPNFEFTCTFCYATTPLQVSTTNPPVGGTFSPPAPGNYQYHVNFNQAIDPGSVATSDLTLTGNVGGRVTAVSVNGSTATFTVHFDNGGSVTASIGAGLITANGCNLNTAFSGDYTVEGPEPCAWAAGPSMPTVGTRMVGVFFPANGKFYAMGGRSSDVGGSEFTHPYEYDPVGNSWTIKSATYPDNQVNNMACGVLTESGIPYIYCAGGSEVATQTATGRVFRYDPVTDTLTTVPANWPSGDANIVPGGFSVYNNNMYIFGGFNINVAMDDNIWQFDPVALVWTHKNSHLPMPLGYIPQATIGNLIYTGGGSTYDGTLHDSNISLVYDPVADTLGNIATIPRATAETRGLNLCNTMYVMGGGREAPNPSNEVDIYDPVANSWSVGMPFSEARRNFPTDTDGTNIIWLSGGYANDGITVLDSMEIFTCPVSPCASPSPTPTATATATPTATATATAIATATATPTATSTPTPTATSTPRQTPTPRPAPTARPRPTPAPRP
jgi:hypothetical protein